MSEIELKFKMKCMAYDLGLSLSNFSHFNTIREMVYLNHFAQ